MNTSDASSVYNVLGVEPPDRLSAKAPCFANARPSGHSAIWRAMALPSFKTTISSLMPG